MKSTYTTKQSKEPTKMPPTPENQRTGTEGKSREQTLREEQNKKSLAFKKAGPDKDDESTRNPKKDPMGKNMRTPAEAV